MIRLIATYFATALAVLVLDIIWLTQFGPKVYFPTLEPVALPSARLPPAVVFYFAYILGILALAIWPTRDKPLLKTTLTGGMLGALCYATYDLTNQATLKVWSTHITVIDITWGTFLTAVGATAGGWVFRRMKA
ncbi:MAG: hypothetical protein A2790_09670 [Phenylobacterium sp. RIFCSPHIGHO2_01_FULL_69_31]|uniref:DUF2177 family protein n=1 Tax=Phenylobacterium sp. RIFCSPHIGHO2_01_FULL_69_31 TaxID=1801944 RepID=UPI0008BB103D|nr:DUF2177 family protein [Phenylobacterium sp. RIFCSPHIGHO2_01_FULL_69_31]OHB30923.1 MAG: hypothetical protein A2790_09670 [Phenylobacterium sp. RIFCSPHIGHO2_01_FULL_69_31]